jgi:hypothetical protein
MSDFRILNDEELHRLSTSGHRDWKAIAEVVALGKGVEIGPCATWLGADSIATYARKALRARLEVLGVAGSLHAATRRTSEGWLVSVWLTRTRGAQCPTSSQ